jgi:hypothetical protein
MQFNIGTWNMQGFSDEKWNKIIEITLRYDLDFFCLQEAGKLADHHGNWINGWLVIGLSGCKSDGYKNNRVSLAILSKLPPTSFGFIPANTRGLLWIKSDVWVIGSWHENRGQGGISTAISTGIKDKHFSNSDHFIVGGDFNDTSSDDIKIGSESRGKTVLSSNKRYDYLKTHPGSNNDLDRFFVSNNLQLIQESVFVQFSDHNPVIGKISDSKGMFLRSKL